MKNREEALAQEALLKADGIEVVNEKVDLEKYGMSVE
jgi:alkylated DNA nucleotide flippase Atl1